MFYSTAAIAIQNFITSVVQTHTWSFPSVHSQMPLVQGPICACTCAAPAKSKMVVLSSVKLEGRNIFKGVWVSRVVGPVVVRAPIKEKPWRGGKTFRRLKKPQATVQFRILWGQRKEINPLLGVSFGSLMTDGVLCVMRVPFRSGIRSRTTRIIVCYVISKLTVDINTHCGG